MHLYQLEERQWIEDLFNEIKTSIDDMHPSKMCRHIKKCIENHRRSGDKEKAHLHLLHAKWKDDNIAPDKTFEEDDDIETYHAAMCELRSEKVNSLKGDFIDYVNDQTGEDKDDPATWRFEGIDWYKGTDGFWQPNQNTKETKDHINKIQFDDKDMLADGGANRCVVNDANILEDVAMLTRPIKMSSANNDDNSGGITCNMIGTLTLKDITGKILKVQAYVSKEVDGIIISPTAITRQHKDRFEGWLQYANFDNVIGELRMIGRETYDNFRLQLSCKNDLWYYAGNQQPLSNASDNIPTINKLSNAANYELWHQRSGHAGITALHNWHIHADGVPELKGNPFYKCPSCMYAKLSKKKPIGKGTSGNHRKMTDNVVSEDLLTKGKLNPKAANKPGQQFAMDFGFVRGSDFKNKLEDGKTVTSIDDKNSYLLIIDKYTRYTWVFLSNSKTPPIVAARRVLNKFKCPASRHRTVRVDQGGELGKSKEFSKMIDEEGFTLETTGADGSAQNGMAERPNQTFGHMMRCLLHASELGSQYWSYALIYAVYIKNRLPHAAINRTPYEAFTGIRPNVKHLRIFGSKVYTRKTGKRAAKLDIHTFSGRFLGFTATPNNITYIDDKSKRIKTGVHVIFDEAHFSETSIKAPFAAETLQRLGYHAKEEYIEDILATEEDRKLYVQKVHKDAKVPTRGSPNSIGYDLFSCNDEDIIIKAGELGIIPTGIAMKCPANTYGRIAPRSGNTIRQQLDTMAGVIDRDYTGEIKVIMYNFGKDDQTISKHSKVAQYIIERAEIAELQEIKILPSTKRGNKGFGSTDIITKPSMEPLNAKVVPIQTPHPIDTFNNHHTTGTAAAAKLHIDLNACFTMPYDINLVGDPIDNYTNRTIRIRECDDDLLGMHVEMCKQRQLPRFLNCKSGSSAMRMPLWRSELRHSYIHAIDEKTVTSINDIKKFISEKRTLCKKNKQTPTKICEVKVTFGTIKKQAMNPQLGIPQLYHDQMNIIGQHLWDIKYEPEWNEKEKDETVIDTQEINHMNDDLKSTMKMLQAYIVATKKDKKGILKMVKKKRKKLTRRFLQKQDDWVDWRKSEHKQLDQYESQGTFSKPTKLPEGSNLLPLLWTYLIKDDGRKKARCVCNGSPRLRGSITLADTYAGSLEQTGAKVFWAASAIYNFITIGADASNAFAEAPAPKAPLYVTIDRPFREWYKERFPSEPPIPEDYVLKVNGALQGHPESARLWAKLIDKVIRKLNLQPCTHEPCLYFTQNYNNTGKTVLFLRQVDDFAVACQDKELAQTVIKDINDKMTINVKELGEIDRFNGVDVQQTKHYVKIYNKTYINKMLQKHIWIHTENRDTTPPTFPIPMHPDTNHQRALESATPSTPEEQKKLEKEMGFGYRQAIGELIYAMVTCRPDISYAVIKLSQYSTKAARVHFEAVKDVYRYLKATKEDGIYYWRKTPRCDLNERPQPTCKEDKQYNEYSIQTRQQQHHNIMRGAVDSDYAGDISHRKSVSGIVLKLAGGTILYKTKYQQIIAQSSTEAEFIAAAEAGKFILYVRSILEDIGIPQQEATTLFEDNNGALLMANQQQPTKRTRHMDIKYFVLQDWVESDLMRLHSIKTSDNYADAMTKPQARTLFHRHMNYIMGKIVPQYSHIFKSTIDTS